MNRRHFLFSSAGAALSDNAVAKDTPVQRPNILVILADDLAAWMLGCYGNQEIKTPNIDNLARAGVRFANSFCATPICSPSRATLFTGRLPRQHGIQDFLVEQPIRNSAARPGSAAARPSASEVMISDILSKARLQLWVCRQVAHGQRCPAGAWLQVHVHDDRRPTVLHRSRDEFEWRDGQGKRLSHGYHDAARMRVSGQAIRRRPHSFSPSAI